MGKSPEDGMASLIQNLETKTGKSLEAWVKLARGSGLRKHKELMAYLKAEHGLTHGYANQIALKAVADDNAPQRGSEDAIDAQYQGAKSGLRPIYDAIVAAVKPFGPDVEIAPKKANVSLRRSKQFGLIQPSTATRVDVGLILKAVPASGRLEPSGSFNAMFTHRVRVTNVAQVDAELIDWLHRAYEQA
jgi:hypothetical protein